MHVNERSASSAVSRTWRYALALAVTLAAVGLRFAMEPWLGPQAPFITFFPAVAIVAWLAGYGPALLAAGVGALAADFFFLGPHGLFEFPYLVMYASFVTASTVIILMSELARRRRSQAALARDALAGSEARNSSVVEHVVDAIITIDLAGSILSFNPAAERLFGYQAAEVLGRNVSMLMPEPYRSEHDQYLQRYAASGTARIIGTGREVQGQRRDGSVFPMDLAVSEFRIGRERHFTGILRDISERRRAEQALRESEMRYRAIVETQAEMVCRFDREGRILFVNGGYAHSRGTTPEVLTGANFWEFIPAEEHAAVQAQLDSLTPQAPEVRIENRFEMVDGVHWTLWTNRALEFDANGRWLQAQSTGVDITRLKQVELALRASEERFRLVADTAPVLIWMSGPDSGCTWFNRRWLDYTGRSLEQERGHGWMAGVHPEDVDRCRDVFRSGFDQREPFALEFRLMGRGGDYRWFVADAAPLYEPDGRFVGFIGACGDHHDFHRAEQALREADRRKDEFLAMLGHELRNPLAAIRSAAELVRLREGGDPVLDKVHGVLDRQSRHMGRLIDGLLEVTRIAQGKIRLNAITLDLRTVLESVVQDRSVAIGHRELTVEQDLGNAPLWVRGDPARLVQVFDNLLGNAIKFSHPHGAVRITGRLGDDGRTVVVVVRDSGVGITPDLLERIFEPFQQVEQEISRDAGGLGLGLALARSLVELHDGEIEARSDGPDQGSEFEVRLPATVPAAQTAEEQPVGRDGPRRLLIVEDNRDAAETLEQLLQIAGYQAAVAPDVQAALNHLENHEVDAVLCDLGLPGGASGYDLARLLRNDPRHAHLLLIALTGYGQARDRQRSTEAGFEAHLTKPVGVEQIQATLQDLLEQRRRADGVALN